MPAWKPVVGPVAGIVEIGELPIMFWLLIWGAVGEKAKLEAAA